MNERIGKSTLFIRKHNLRFNAGHTPPAQLNGHPKAPAKKEFHWNSVHADFLDLNLVTNIIWLLKKSGMNTQSFLPAEHGDRSESGLRLRLQL